MSESQIITEGEEETDDNDDDDDDAGEESEGEEMPAEEEPVDSALSSPLPMFPANQGQSCWSQPEANLFHVRGPNYLKDRVKVTSGPTPFTCRGVDIWMTDNPERHIARHPAVLGGKLHEEDTFLVNFLLPFGNFVAYFSIPPLKKFPEKLRSVWTKFLKGDQEYRDARLKLLPIVVGGPWIVKTAVGPGKSPALLGKVIPLQYFFRDPDKHRKGVYEVDVIITASKIAKGILSVVKGHTPSVSIAFAFIIEAANAEDLPETVLCCFQVHSLHLEDCPRLPPFDFDEDETSCA
jgi:Protein ENHANCED DISEASE RESISTANCE 2, C-terminal